MASARSSLALVAVFCVAEILSMAGFALVPSLLPKLSLDWGMSATAGGWLGGIFFLGYIVAVPVLVSLTDRLDARRVYLASAALSGFALAGFALFARCFEAALFWWWLAGLGLAGTYMPGLKALTDRLPVAAQSRATAFYTASFGVGAGLSYLWLELSQSAYAWPVLFGIAACCVALAVLLVFVLSPPASFRRQLTSRAVAGAACLATGASSRSAAPTSATTGSFSVSAAGWSPTLPGRMARRRMRGRQCPA